MIIYRNIQRITGLEFESYLERPGHSHSSLKQHAYKDFIVTDKVRVGKIVDDILTNKGANCDITHKLYPAARDIADTMTRELGIATLALLTFQVSYVCEVEFEGLRMTIKGRPDAELGKIAVIDFKVNNSCKNVEDCRKLIEFMGYDNQLYNYGRMGNKKHHYIFIYSTIARRTFFLKRLVKEEDVIMADNWWAEKILENGTL